MASKKPCILQLPRVFDVRGSLTFVQDSSLPFEIKRVYWIYDVPAAAVRGSHAHKTNEAIIIAAHGSFVVEIFDGRETVEYHLDTPWEGLYVPAGYWNTLNRFSSGSLCLVLTSDEYDEEDYIRDLDEFIKTKQ